MIPYIVIFTTIIAAGRLRLTPDQARSRMHNLRDCGDGVYEIATPVQFKRGEQFDYDGLLPKSMASQITQITEIAAERANTPTETDMSKSESAPEAQIHFRRRRK